MGYRWISAVHKTALALILAVAAAHARAETVAEYDFRLILVKDKATIEQVQRKLDAGADFGKMAMENSIDRGSAGDGGLAKHVQASTLHGVFANELENLKPGKRSTQARNSEFGWFVIKLESVRMVEDEGLKRARAHQERDEKIRQAREQEGKDQAEFEAVKAKFTSCARRAAALEGDNDELERRVDMYNSGVDSFSASELRAQRARLNRRAAAFNDECTNIRANDEIVRICSHPAYQSRWCRSSN